MVQAEVCHGGGSGSTFLLQRGCTNQATEGVRAPTVLRDMGLTSMLDLAGAFDSVQEVRSACRSADQPSVDMAETAWQQSKQRAPQIASALAARLAIPGRPAGLPSSSLTTLHHYAPPAPPRASPTPAPPTPFAVAPLAIDRTLVQTRDLKVESVKKATSTGLWTYTSSWGRPGCNGKSVLQRTSQGYEYCSRLDLRGCQYHTSGPSC